jgi:hypothetical protein
LFECVLTGHLKINDQTRPLLRGSFSEKGISEPLYEVSTGATRKKVKPFSYPTELLRRPETSLEHLQKAQEAVAQITSAAPNMQSVAEIATLLESRTEDLGYLPPTVLKASLGAVSDRMEQLSSAAGHSGQEAREQQVRARFAALRPPATDFLDSKWQDLIYRIAAGKATSLDASESRFIAGALANSAKKCNQPATDVRLRLASIYFKGTVSMSFDIRGSDDPATAASRPLEATNDIVAGDNFVENNGCSSDFIEALFVTLAEPAEATSNQRPSVLARSCALDQDLQKCECIAAVAEEAFAGSRDQFYTRDIIARSSLDVVTMGQYIKCGVREY